MISGPVFPRTRGGLMELVERQLDQVERGLAVLETDLELEPGCEIEALARDAAGRPVLVLLVDPGEPRQITPRLLAARAWLAAGTPLLARALSTPGVDWSLPLRFVVVGFEVSDALVEQLAQAGGGQLDVYELRPFRIGARHLLGALPRLHAAAAARSESGFTVPGGLDDGEARGVCSHFLDLMQRLEPDLQVFGDRYSRSFRLDGEVLADLLVHGQGLLVTLPGVDERERRHVITSRTDCAAVVDRIARLYLERAAAELPAPGTVTQPRPAPPRSERVSTSPFDGIRRSVEDARHLSDQEYSILGQSFEDE